MFDQLYYDSNLSHVARHTHSLRNPLNCSYIACQFSTRYTFTHTTIENCQSQKWVFVWRQQTENASRSTKSTFNSIYLLDCYFWREKSTLFIKLKWILSYWVRGWRFKFVTLFLFPFHWFLFQNRLDKTTRKNLTAHWIVYRWRWHVRSINTAHCWPSVAMMAESLSGIF